MMVDMSYLDPFGLGFKASRFSQVWDLLFRRFRACSMFI